MTKRATNRRIYLIAKQGSILEGIKYSKKKGLNVPNILLIMNKPELLEDSRALEQLISPMTREVLAMRIREELSKGIDLWPKHRRR